MIDTLTQKPDLSEQDLEDLAKEIALIRAENKFLDPSVTSESVRIDANVLRLIEIRMRLTHITRPNLRENKKSLHKPRPLYPRGHLTVVRS